MIYAAHYYERGLMIKYGLLALHKLMELHHENEVQADQFVKKWMQFKRFYLLKEAIVVIKEEEKIRMTKLERIADRYYSVTI